MIFKTRQKKNRHIGPEDYLNKPVLNNTTFQYNLEQQRMESTDDTYPIGTIVHVEDLGDDYELTIDLLESAFDLRSAMFFGQSFEFTLKNKNPQA